MVIYGREERPRSRRYCTIWLVQADWTGGGTIGHFGPMEMRGFRGGGVGKSAGLLPTDITSKYAVQSASCRDSAHLILSYLQVHRFVYLTFLTRTLRISRLNYAFVTPPRVGDHRVHRVQYQWYPSLRPHVSCCARIRSTILPDAPLNSLVSRRCMQEGLKNVG